MCGLLEGPLRDLWYLHDTIKVTDTPATNIPSGMLLASRLSTWCSLGLSLM